MDFSDDLPNPSDNAPEDLLILAQNVKDILSNVERIRGREYASKLMLLFTTYSHLHELSDIACTATTLLYHACIDDPDKQSLCETNHSLSHLYSTSLEKNMDFMIQWMEAMPEYSGITKDVEMIMNRIQSDWKDKGH